ncbi:hypothetical protein PS15m_004771 [Mucor circinelloides]
MSTPFLSLNSLAKKSPPTNRIRLAAVSNYKLAQLTFAPPNDCTLRKTALIKNLVEIIYKHTPNEHLAKNMVRWGYFTPESLDDMTQKDVEKIVYRYSQVVYSTAITLGKEESKKEQRFLCSDYPEITAETQELDEMSAYYASLFSSSVFFKDTLFRDETISSCSESDADAKYENDEMKLPEKPIELHPQRFQPKLEIVPTLQPTYPSKHPSSSNNHSTNEKNTSRLSWLSDTGVPTNSTVALKLASELMTLFDMEFNVDLSVPSLHELKKLESGNGSTTSLHKVFSANEYPSSDDDDEQDQDQESEQEDDVRQERQVVQAHQVDLKLTAEQQNQRDLGQREISCQQHSTGKKKAFHLIPTLKQLGSRSSTSNSDDSISSASSNTAPSTPTHYHFKASPVPAHLDQNYRYYYSSSSDSEQEEEQSGNDIAQPKATCNRIGSDVRRIVPPNRSSSLEYRASLQDIFMLSDEDSSDASSDYFNDSVDTFQVKLNCSRDSAGVDSPSFKGFLSALSSIRKTRPKSKQNPDETNSTIASSHVSAAATANKEGPTFDSTGKMRDGSKRKDSMQKVVKYLSGHSSNRATLRRESVVSNNLSISATSTIMSGSSMLSEDRHAKTTTAPSSPTSPITLSPRVARRHGVYTTSILSDTSSFNWAEETRQKDEFGSIHSKASSSKTIPAFFNANKQQQQQQQQQRLARSSSTTSLGGLLKKLTGFHKKDKMLQRA